LAVAECSFFQRTDRKGDKRLTRDKAIPKLGNRVEIEKQIKKQI
jgi:hypothetical protein